MTDFATNPRARHDYDILETLEAGLALSGHEVKSAKSGRASIKGAYVRIINGIPLLMGAAFAPYQPGNQPEGYREQGDRKLLLSAREIASLEGLQQAHGIALVPLRLYGKKGRVKLEIGIARGRKRHDKREAIKKKDVARARMRGMADE